MNLYLKQEAVSGCLTVGLCCDSRDEEMSFFSRSILERSRLISLPSEIKSLHIHQKTTYFP